MLERKAESVLKEVFVKITFSIALSCILATFILADQAFVAENIDALSAKAKELESKIVGLPVRSPDEQRKRAVLEIAMIYLNSCIEGNNADRAKALVSDIEAGFAMDLGKMDNSQQFFLPLGSPERNKDLADFYKAVEANLADKDKAVPVVKDGKGLFAKLDVNNTRRNGDEIFNYFLATAHKDSRYVNNIELFKRALNRVLLFIEGDKKNVNFSEFFTQDRNYFAIYAFRKVFPNALLPSQSAMCMKVADDMQKKNLQDYKDGKLRDWINENLAIASGLVHAGLILGNKEYVDAGLDILALHTSEQFSDGGLQYFRGQNESIGYHGINVEVANRIYLSTGNQTALNLIKKSENHTLLGVEPVIVGSFSSAPSWKWTWNTGYSTPRPVVFYTKNPYLKAYQDTIRAYAQASGKIPVLDAMSAMLDISDIQTKPLPDNYFVYDSNIMGARSRYGNFSTLMIGRNAETPAGLLTYVSAMAVDSFDPKRPKPLNAAMKGVFAGPRLKINDEKPGERWNGTANLGVENRNTCIIGHDFSALVTKHRLTGTDFGPSRWDSSWSGDQQWLALPDRIIGMVTVYPGTENAFDVRGIVKLGHGGTGVMYPKKIEKIDDSSYSYGDLTVRVRGQNYGKISVQEKTGLLRDGRANATDIVFTDDISEKDGSQVSRKYEKPYYFIVECDYKGAKGDAKVEKIDKSDLKGFKVVLNGETFVVLQNTGKTAIDLKTADYAGGQAYVHNGFVPNQENMPVKVETATIAPEKGILISNVKNANKAPFKSFNDMMILYGKGQSDGVTPFPFADVLAQ